MPFNLLDAERFSGIRAINLAHYKELEIIVTKIAFPAAYATIIYQKFESNQA